MKQIVKFKSVTIKDFKNIGFLEVKLGKLNELYGKNKTGKSAVLEAIHFACRGGKSDVNKIKNGADKAEVIIDIVENDIPISVKTSINLKGNVTCKAKVNGIDHNQPRTLINRLLTFGTFNPRELLDKQGRLERLLNLIPIHITEKDLKVPSMKVYSFPISDPASIDYSEHAYKVLEALNKDLRNTRWFKGREVDMLKKNLQKRTKDLEDATIAFTSNYSTDPLSIEGSYEGHLEESKKGEVSLSAKKTQLNFWQKDLTELQHKVKGIEDKNIEDESRIKELRYKMDFLQNNIKDRTKEKEEASMLITKKENEIRDSVKEVEDLEAALQERESKKNMYREVGRIKFIKKDVDAEQELFSKKEEEWKTFDVLLKKVFPALQKAVLKPISDKVPGLTIEEKDIKYKGISVDALSGSEILELSVILMKLQKNSNILLINEAECMDRDSIKGIDFKDLSSVIIARVGEEPLDGWNSVKMGGKNGK